MRWSQGSQAGGRGWDGADCSPLRPFLQDFKKLMGTTCDIRWREAARGSASGWLSRVTPLSRVWDAYFEIDHEEMLR